MAITDTRTLIVGGGSRGSVLAARLIEKGISVDLLTGAERQEHLTLRGVHLTSPFGRFRGNVSATVRPDSGAPYHLIVLAVRAHLLEDAIAGIDDHVSPSTIILSVVDGGPYLDGLQQRFPANRVYEGLLEGRLLMDADGIVNHRPPKVRLLLGADDTTDTIAKNIATLLAGRGIRAQVVTDLSRRQWTRSLFLAAGVGTTTMTRQPLRDALRFLPGRTYFSYMLREGREIASAAGITIDRNDTLRYRRGLFMEGEPIASPPRISDPGGASDEARHLLGAMVERAQALHTMAPNLELAWKTAHEGTTAELDVCA